MGSGRSLADVCTDPLRRNPAQRTASLQLGNDLGDLGIPLRIALLNRHDLRFGLQLVLLVEKRERRIVFRQDAGQLAFLRYAIKGGPCESG